MNHDKFLYIYKKIIYKDSINHSWYVVNKKSREGTHFHGTEYLDEKVDSIFRANQFNFSPSGIESHNTKPKYGGQKPMENCWVTGGDCYTDGSSLQAQERFEYVNPYDKFDIEYIWRTLETYYGYWIEPNDQL